MLNSYKIVILANNDPDFSHPIIINPDGVRTIYLGHIAELHYVSLRILNKELFVGAFGEELLDVDAVQSTTVPDSKPIYERQVKSEDEVKAKLTELASSGLSAEAEDQYVDLLKDLIHESVLGNSIPNRLLYLTEILSRVGESHIQKAREAQKPELYTEAAKFYQYILSIAEKKLAKSEHILEKIYNAYQQLNVIKKELIMLVGGDVGKANFEQVSEESSLDKVELLVLRESSRANLIIADKYLEATEDILLTQEQEREFIENSRALFADIAKSIKLLLARIFKESEVVLGEPPCDYTVMGLGSLALQQITPYSDIEFAILTKNDDYRNSASLRVREYFKSLTHLVHLRVVNLGETVIETSKYKVDLGNLITRAVNFDLGGKTPLGRPDKPYELIQTVEGMLHYFRNADDRAEHRDKNLPYILEVSTYIYGDEQLLNSYQREAVEFLSQLNAKGVPHYEMRAAKRLKEGVVEYEYSYSQSSSSVQIINKSHYPGDISHFEHKLSGRESEGRIFDVKQEIYRLPERLLYSLAFFYGVQPQNVWNAIEKLGDAGIIGATEESKEAVHHLLYAASFATILRLRTYSHNGEQKESVSIFAKTERDSDDKQNTQAFHLSEKELREDGALFKYYYATLPLHHKLEEFSKLLDETERLEKVQRNSFFKDEVFNSNTFRIKAEIYVKLMQYRKAIEQFKQELIAQPSNSIVLEQLGVALYNSGEYDEALKIFSFRLKERTLNQEVSLLLSLQLFLATLA